MKSILTSRGVLRVSVAFLMVLILLGGSLVFFVSGSDPRHEAIGEEPQTEFPPVRVNAVRPHFDKSFSMVEKRPADVEAYYRVHLDSRVPGIIREIRVAAGATVKKGQKLVDVHVPEREERVKEQEANLVLAKAQIDQMNAALKAAQEMENVWLANVEALKAKVKSLESYREFRQKQAIRYAELLRNKAIDARLVDEQQDRLVAAQQDVIATNEAIHAGMAQITAAKAKVEEAQANLEEANAKYGVAKAALEHSRVMRDFAIIKAPFDGMIVRRNLHANVGANVVEADTNDNPDPMLVLERQDIVTIVMHVPDNFATYITPDTEAIFETPTLPGVKIHGKVTRYPTSLVNPQKDRTMPVEIDLWNDSPEKFNEKKDDPEFRKDLKTGLPGHSNLPVLPRIEGRAPGRQMRLMPGMWGTVTLNLSTFNNVYLLPTSALDIQGGYQYIYVVKDGKAHHQPVKVQVDDGKLMKVNLLDANGEPSREQLTDQEQVIVSNLGELSEGQRVDPTLVENENWKSIKKESKR